jgi:hypothetical protein
LLATVAAQPPAGEPLATIGHIGRYGLKYRIGEGGQRRKQFFGGIGFFYHHVDGFQFGFIFGLGFGFILIETVAAQLHAITKLARASAHT